MPEAVTAKSPVDSPVDLAAAGAYIAGQQRASGEIPWSAANLCDPWDHVESAMGLTAAGFLPQARRAYLWSAGAQLADGSWWSEYWNGVPSPQARQDANMSAYIAVGVYHYYLCTGDRAFLARMRPVVERAMEFVIGLQNDQGAIRWARRADGSVSERTLLTGSCSIYFSLGCALEIAAALGLKRPGWRLARRRLGRAIRGKPHLFDQSKSRYAMDWFYPVLSGALRGSRAAQRIDDSWDVFCRAGWGVRCVRDQEWFTMAETAELTMALCALGRFRAAQEALGWIAGRRYEDGAYMTGVTYPQEAVYTREKTTWTAAAVILAADVVYGLTPAGRLYRSP